MLLTNFHAHTYRCHHAQGTEEEMVQSAIAAGFDELGFADHGCWPYQTGFVSPIRMSVEELDDYIDTVLGLKEKYRDAIRIRLGMEYEGFPEFFPWLREMKREKGLEYCILGNHYDTNDDFGGFYFGACSQKKHLYRYMETTIEGMESGLFEYLAHPDLCLHRYGNFDDAAERVCRELCRSANRLGMPVEFNILGLRRHVTDRAEGYLGYTNEHFWRIAAEENVRAIIGVDAHTPSHMDCAELYRDIYKALTDAGIEVVQEIGNQNENGIGY